MVVICYNFSEQWGIRDIRCRLTVHNIAKQEIADSAITLAETVL